MGDRIAILRDGALVQYDTPEAILARPADAFVESFVGADRALKRLALIRADAALEPLAALAPAHVDRRRTTSLRDALALHVRRRRRRARGHRRRRRGDRRASRWRRSAAHAIAPAPH